MGQELTAWNGLPIEKMEESLAGQLADSSKELYLRDMKYFGKWITSQGLVFTELTYDDLVQYRKHLDGKYANSTAGRMLVVARKVMAEAYKRGLIKTNPATDVRGFTTDDSSPRRALSEDECRKMLKAIDRTEPKGKRDYALLALMIRTGIRRAEVVALTIGDVGTDQGYYIITIRHGKGDKRRIAKLQPDLHTAIQEYLLTREDATPADPLFVGITKSGKWKTTPLHMYGGLNYILRERARTIEIALTPHDLRATFATLALENNAPLHKVQYAMGHKDPRTTERYDKRGKNLKDNATDYIHLSDL